MPPVLPFVVQSLIQNFHYLDEVVPGWSRKGLTRTEVKWNENEDELVVCHLGDLVHLGARGTPGIVGGGIADLCLDVRVTFCIVLGDTESALAKVLDGHDESGGRVRNWSLSFLVQSEPGADPQTAQLIPHVPQTRSTPF